MTEIVKHKGMITLSVMLATIMEVMDTTIANVALPHIQGSLNASHDQMAWVLTSYIVSAAVATPLAGWLTKQYGVKHVLLTCIAGFTISSACCGFATSLTQMVVFRLLQGIFGAALIPMSQSLLLDINPKEKHGQAMATWGVGIMVAPIVGPIVGGYITEYYNWRWIFFINLPVGILAFIGIATFLQESHTRKTSFDILGFTLFSLFIFSLQIMLDRGEQKDWFESREIIIYAYVSIISFTIFLLYGQKHPHPFIPLQIFRDKNYAVSTLLMFFMGIILFSSIAIIPQYLQNLIGYSVIDAGLLIAPRGLGVMLAMFISGQIVGKIDARIPIGLGLSLSTLTLHIMTSFDLNVTKYSLIYTGVMQGFGLGCVFVPLSTLAFSTLPAELRPQASAIFSLLRNIGGAIGISIIIFLTGYWFKENNALLTEHVFSGSKNLDQYMARLPVIDQNRQLLLLDYQVKVQSMLIGYINAFKILFLVNLCIIPSVLLISSGKNNKMSMNLH